VRRQEGGAGWRRMQRTPQDRYTDTRGSAGSDAVTPPRTYFWFPECGADWARPPDARRDRFGSGVRAHSLPARCLDRIRDDWLQPVSFPEFQTLHLRGVSLPKLRRASQRPHGISSPERPGHADHAVAARRTPHSVARTRGARGADAGLRVGSAAEGNRSCAERTDAASVIASPATRSISVTMFGQRFCPSPKARHSTLPSAHASTAARIRLVGLSCQLRSP